jgi:hypothetical protein
MSAAWSVFEVPGPIPATRSNRRQLSDIVANRSENLRGRSPRGFDLVGRTHGASLCGAAETVLVPTMHQRNCRRHQIGGREVDRVLHGSGALPSALVHDEPRGIRKPHPALFPTKIPQPLFQDLSGVEDVGVRFR